MATSFREEVRGLILRAVHESGHGTPDQTLAYYLLGCLTVFTAGSVLHEQVIADDRGALSAGKCRNGHDYAEHGAIDRFGLRVCLKCRSGRKVRYRRRLEERAAAK